MRRFLVTLTVLSQLFTLFVFASEECSNRLIGPYVGIPAKNTESKVLKFGDKLQIFSQNGGVQSAYFVGSVGSRIYFAPTDSASIRRPLFYVNSQEIQFEQKLELQNGSEWVKPMTPPEEITRVYSSENSEYCSALTVMACLDHLNQLGILPNFAKAERMSNPTRILNEMTAAFGPNAIDQSEEGKILSFRFERAENRRERKKAGEEYRDFGFNRITEFLLGLGVKSRLTSSIRELIKHLKAGKPAYISVNTEVLDVTRPSLVDWTVASGWNWADNRHGVGPAPLWARSSVGFHSVYALGVLPRATGVGGFLRGHRLVILDSELQSLQIWDQLSLGLFGSAKFVLIGE